MTYLLDANVFLDFQRAGVLSELVKAAAGIPMAVAEKVLDEVTLAKADDSSDVVGRKRAASALLHGSAIEVLEIAPGSPEATLMKVLLGPIGGRPDKDKGEAASIALASTAPNLVFVTGDRNAVLVALNELFGTGSERVMRVPVFVRLLFERGVLTADVVRRAAERAASHGAIPSWWPSWTAALSP